MGKRFKALPTMTGPLPARLAKHHPASNGCTERLGLFHAWEKHPGAQLNLSVSGPNKAQKTWPSVQRLLTIPGSPE